MTLHNSEYERIVLGSLLIDTKILDDYDFNDGLFYHQTNKTIFKTIIGCIESGVKPDIIVIADKLKDTDISLSYVSGLTTATPSAANVSFYRDALEELARKRKLDMLFKVAGTELAGKTTAEIIERIEDVLTHLNSEKSKGYLPIKDFTGKAIERIEKKYHHEYQGIRYGYRDMDYHLEEIPNGTLTVIAARTSMGKTAASLNIAYNILKQKKKVGYFSCEMSGDLIAERLIQKIAMVNTRKIRDLKSEGFSRMNDACDDLYEAQFFVDDTPNIYLYELKSKARKMKREGIDIIFIDYLGLIKYENEKLSLYEKYGAISKELKQLARELELPIVALHQLNRAAEGQKPTLDQLRNSGAIEEDADVIILMSGERKENEMELTVDIAKNRLGASGEARLIFKKEYQSIHDIDFTTKE